MKSERKQVQESNLLADKIEAQFIKIKKSLPTILTVVGVTVVVLLGYGFYSSAKEAEAAKGWTAYYFSDSDNLSKVSNDFSGTTAGLWARQASGDQNIARALESVYIDREVSDQYFKLAIEDYKFVADKATNPFLKERALYGQAQAAEGLADREQAQLLYRKVAASSSISPEMLAAVNKRVNWLESKAGEDFFAWFKSNRPSAPVPQPSSPAALPLPTSPSISFPPVPSSNLPPAEAKAPKADESKLTKEPAAEPATSLDSPTALPSAAETPKP